MCAAEEDGLKLRHGGLEGQREALQLNPEARELGRLLSDGHSAQPSSQQPAADGAELVQWSCSPRLRGRRTVVAFPGQHPCLPLCHSFSFCRNYLAPFRVHCPVHSAWLLKGFCHLWLQ